MFLSVKLLSHQRYGKNSEKYSVFKTFFQTDERTKLEIMEFLTGIDIDLTPDCLRAVLRIYSAIKKNTTYERLSVSSKNKILDLKLN